MSEQKSPHEDFILVVIVIGLIFGLSWAIWAVYKTELSSALRWVRVAEMKAISLYRDDQELFFTDANGNTIKDARSGYAYGLNDWYNWAKDAHAQDITPAHLGILTRATMEALRAPFVIILGLMSLWVMLFGPGTQFRRQMNLEGLIATQSKTFPVIAPFIKFNPAKLPYRAPGQPVPQKLPLFAEALAPEEWVAYNRVPLKDDGSIDQNAAAKAFAKQLRRRWQGPTRLPIHAQALFAAFALKHVRKRKECDVLLNDLARCWSPQKGFRITGKLRRQVKSIINNKKIGGALAKHCQKHAFQTPALLKALARARAEGGVLAPAQFVWLRGHDRGLWYPLNNLGRKSFHPEAAGAMSHYISELNACQRIPSPKMREAVDSIDQALKMPGARPVPPLSK